MPLPAAGLAWPAVGLTALAVEEAAFETVWDIFVLVSEKAVVLGGEGGAAGLSRIACATAPHWGREYLLPAFSCFLSIIALGAGKGGGSHVCSPFQMISVK